MSFKTGYTVTIRRPSEYHATFFFSLDGHLVDITEWEVKSKYGQKRAKNYLKFYGCHDRIPWGWIECKGSRADAYWVFKCDPLEARKWVWPDREELKKQFAPSIEASIEEIIKRQIQNEIASLLV